jgi:hypothetical protein
MKPREVDTIKLMANQNYNSDHLAALGGSLSSCFLSKEVEEKTTHGNM